MSTSTPKFKIKKFICKGCGNLVKKRCRQGSGYCSLECYRLSPSRPSRLNGTTVICSNCGKSIYKQKCHLAYKDHFCDRLCFLEWWGSGKTKHICQICGKEFRWSPSRSKGKYKIKYCSIKCRDSDPSKVLQLIKMNVRQQTMKVSKLETFGYQILDNLGISYLKQHLIGGKFCVDAFIPEVGLVIQFDGDYWHGNPNSFPELNKRQLRRKKLDLSQDSYMRACGFEVIRLWESTVYKAPNEITGKLQRLIVQRGHTHAPPLSDQA